MGEHSQHIILITDGQVSQPTEIIKIISKMKKENVGKTHVIGIGEGGSYEMIKKGAI